MPEPTPPTVVSLEPAGCDRLEPVQRIKFELLQFAPGTRDPSLLIEAATGLLGDLDWEKATASLLRGVMLAQIADDPWATSQAAPPVAAALLFANGQVVTILNSQPEASTPDRMRWISRALARAEVAFTGLLEQSLAGVKGGNRG